MIKLIKREEVLRLTGAGGLLLYAVLTLALIILADSLHSFLHVNEQIGSDIPIAEDLIEDAAHDGIIDIFKGGKYKTIIATGTPLTHGITLPPYDNYVELTHMRRLTAGLPLEQMLTASARDHRMNRTRAPMTTPWHSHDIYRNVLKSEYSIGIISIDNSNFTARGRWLYSKGVKSALSELFAYVYNICFTAFRVFNMGTVYSF